MYTVLRLPHSRSTQNLTGKLKSQSSPCVTLSLATCPAQVRLGSPAAVEARGLAERSALPSLAALRLQGQPMPSDRMTPAVRVTAGPGAQARPLAILRHGCPGQTRVSVARRPLWRFAVLQNVMRWNIMGDSESASGDFGSGLVAPGPWPAVTASYGPCWPAMILCTLLPPSKPSVASQVVETRKPGCQGPGDD